jgi:hypothetical protein
MDVGCQIEIGLGIVEHRLGGAKANVLQQDALNAGFWRWRHGRRRGRGRRIG